MKDQVIPFFKGNDYKIDTSKFSNLLHDKIVTDFEKGMAEYVGAKYCCSLNSATSAIFLMLLEKEEEILIPSMIPPVVLNAILTSGNTIAFKDEISWIGNSYTLHDFGEYKIIDSAQKVEKNQFKIEANDNDLMFFSHYPTKPIGSCDGCTVVSNDPVKIEHLRKISFNGMSFQKNNWERSIDFPGYKMYMNSIQAYIALENLRRLDDNKKKIKKIREIYNEELGYRNNSDHLYRIEVKDNRKIIEKLKQKKIICGIHYFPQNKNKIYRGDRNFSCPLSESLENKTLSLPFFPSLNEKDQDKIIKEIKKII